LPGGTLKAFDYIIVGSGSAGSIVAARLSEDSDVSVLLLEAGRPDDHPFMAMPIAFPKVSRNRAYIWPYETEPEPGLDNRKLLVWRGKTLGGCSSVNAMINVRGSRFDYDGWRQQGLEGWGYRDVLPYFKKMETSWRGGGLYHGARGPVGVAPVDLPESMFPHFELAALNAGLPVCSDHNGAGQEGISRIELTTKDGNRSSTARAYLHPAMKARPNLTVLTNAQTTRVIFHGKRATGVEVLRNGAPERIYADREIVLCAGTYASPQLLMLSGIGPADHLRSVGVDVLHDLKGVGQNLQEHPNLLNIYRANGPRGFTNNLRVDQATLNVARWALFGEGPFATAGTTANLFLRTRPELERPDVQIIMMPLHQHAALRVHVARRHFARAVARLGEAALFQSARSAANPLQHVRRTGGHGHDGGRRKAQPRSLQSITAARDDRRGADARQSCAKRRRSGESDPSTNGASPSRLRHLPDGDGRERRCRRAIARHRHRKPARGRRLRDA
jgi:choline dehydrogenase